MYLDEPIISRLESLYGRPWEAVLAYEIGRKELVFIRSTQVDGRAHDVTAFINYNREVAVIKKPSYPEGAWRVPSGGVRKGELFEEGATREVREETGLEVRLTHYLYRIFITFSSSEESVEWTTHVMEAELISPPPPAELNPLDTREITAARFMDWPTLLGPVREALLATPSGGLTYRAHLHDLVYRRFFNRD